LKESGGLVFADNDGLFNGNREVDNVFSVEVRGSIPYGTPAYQVLPVGPEELILNDLLQFIQGLINNV
jgi:hypothetical protein